MIFQCLLLFLCLGVALSVPECQSVLKDPTPFSGQCASKWGDIKPFVKPTQSEVGYAWIQYKLDKDFTSEKKSQSTMDSSPTPAVIGPDSLFYFVDDHHTSCALDYSGYWNVSVIIDIICDKRLQTKDSFWQDMVDQHLVYLNVHPDGSANTLPVPVQPDQLPASFDFTKAFKSMRDDRWRSLAGFSRKVTTVPGFPACSGDKNCYSCFHRGCVDGTMPSGPGVAFFEFRWGYFFNDATYYHPDLWPTQEQFQTFKGLYSALPEEMSSTQTANWLDAASNLVSLCRYSLTGNYSTPSYLFTGSPLLPGYVEGEKELPADPNCDSPSCQ